GLPVYSTARSTPPRAYPGMDSTDAAAPSAALSRQPPQTAALSETFIRGTGGPAASTEARFNSRQRSSPPGLQATATPFDRRRSEAAAGFSGCTRLAIQCSLASTWHGPANRRTRRSGFRLPVSYG